MTEYNTPEMYQIEMLLYKYCDYVDRIATEELHDLFSEDAVIDYGFNRIFSGREAIVNLLSSRLRLYSATSHHLSNVQITNLTTNTAECRSYIYAWHQLENGSTAEVWGRYFDQVVKENTSWKISKRTIRAAGSRGFTTPDNLPSAFEPIVRNQG